MTDPSNSGPIIEVAGVIKRYGATESASVALAGLDLRVERGEFISLMGPSGSGKTTLLNLIAGLDEPDQGRVVVCGRDLSTLRDHELANLRLRSVGFVF